MINGLDMANQLNNAAQSAVQQQVTVPDTLEVSLRVNIKEALMLMEGLGHLQMNRVNVLASRVQAMTNQAVSDFINPPPGAGTAGLQHAALQGELAGKAGLPPRGEPMMGDEDNLMGRAPAFNSPWPHRWYQVSNNTEAHTALSAAEAARRGVNGMNPDNGTLDVKPAAHPDDDYAAATTFVSHAMHHLDEGLPNGQRDRCTRAYAALRYGCWKLGQFLDAKLALNANGEPL